jgi:hypothetical protein
MKRYHIISILFWTFFLICVLTLGSSETTSWNKVNFPYILEKEYLNFSDVLLKFFEINLSSDLFNYCCDLINFFGNYLGFSYTQMNLIIFVIGLPMFIVNLILIVVFQLIEIKKLNRKLLVKP